jgi:hypothetical protein
MQSLYCSSYAGGEAIEWFDQKPGPCAKALHYLTNGYDTDAAGIFRLPVFEEEYGPRW